MQPCGFNLETIFSAEEAICIDFSVTNIKSNKPSDSSEVRTGGLTTRRSFPIAQSTTNPWDLMTSNVAPRASMVISTPDRERIAPK